MVLVLSAYGSKERRTMNASGRRYKMAKMKFKCWAPRQRPNYKIRDAAAAQRHLEALIAREQRIRMGSKKKKVRD